MHVRKFSFWKMNLRKIRLWKLHFQKIYNILLRGRCQRRYSLKNLIVCTYQYHSYQSLTLLFHLTRLGRLDEVVGTRIDWRPVELRLGTGKRGKAESRFSPLTQLGNPRRQLWNWKCWHPIRGSIPHPTHLIHVGLGMSNCVLVVSPSMHYRLRPIKRGQFRFANFAPHVEGNCHFHFLIHWVLL